jgi:hypothetical protein
MTTNSRSGKRSSLVVLSLLLAMVMYGFTLRSCRTRAFRDRANAGQPIVRAIEAYREGTGHYPENLADLVPKYLPTTPDLPDAEQHKYTGWEYHVVTNADAVSYRLRSYLGHGGVEYQPPQWIGNDEGDVTIIITNRSLLSGYKMLSMSWLE